MMRDPQEYPDTLAVHAGQTVHGGRTLPVPPLVLNSAIPLVSIEEGWDMLTNETEENIAYQRYGNPTVSVLEKKFAALEKANFVLAVNSGMAATYLLFRSILKAGDHIISQHALYHEISDQLALDRIGCAVDYSLISEYSTECFISAMRPETRMVFIETPTNPAMLDVDIPALAEACRSRDIILVVDNTLLAYYQRPLDLGADIVVYSTTKTINGHGDALGGLIATNSSDLAGKVRNFRDNTGLCLDPFSAYLTLRGLRTLPLRLTRHSENTEKVLAFLDKQYPNLEVRYAGRSNYRLQNRISGGGGIVSLVLPTKTAGAAFVRHLRLFKLATTFGNLESLVYHFGTFARPHRDLSKIGLPLGLVRLSIGIEDISDILADLDGALNAAYQHAADDWEGNLVSQ